MVDRVKKMTYYAESAIPLYLLVERYPAWFCGCFSSRAKAMSSGPVRPMTALCA